MSKLSNQPDYSVLDRPDIIQFVFYPRKEWTSLTQGASDFFIPVEDEISISCRFYPLNPAAPCILYFHGNGEIACDYDQVAPLYHAQGVSLFVADFRGYGLSDGEPSFSSMMKDAESIFEFFTTFIIMPYQTTPLFIMGRSLGAHSAVALASLHPEKFKGLILESGSANFSRLLSWFEFASPQQAKELEEATLARIRSITLPVLIIHGECDDLIPVSEATLFHEIVGSKEKKLVLIPDGTHNDIMLVGKEQYFQAIKEFIFR
jgi:alpha-beta hydrolase superfamily lysophospholipase